MHMSCAGSWATRRQPMHLAVHALALVLAQSGWTMFDALALRRGLSSVGSADGALHHPIRMLRMRVPCALASRHHRHLHRRGRTLRLHRPARVRRRRRCPARRRQTLVHRRRFHQHRSLRRNATQHVHRRLEPARLSLTHGAPRAVAMAATVMHDTHVRCTVTTACHRHAGIVSLALRAPACPPARLGDIDAALAILAGSVQHTRRLAWVRRLARCAFSTIAPASGGRRSTCVHAHMMAARL